HMYLMPHDRGVMRHKLKHIRIIYQVRLIEEGTAEEIFNNPQHLYTKRLIAAIPDTNVDKIDENLHIRQSVKEEYDQHFHEYLDEDGRALPLINISATHKAALPAKG